MSKLTQKHIRLFRYNSIITRNKAKFEAGMKLTRKQFVRMFSIRGIVHEGTYKDVHRSNLRLVQVQKELNVLMRENGLYIQSRDYYSEFLVQSKNATKNTVKRYSRGIDLTSAMTDRLDARMEERCKEGTWGTYRPVDVLETQAHIEPSRNHLRTSERVKTY